MRHLRRLHPRMLLAVVAGLLLAGWLVPPFFHAGRYRRIVRAGLESRLGRPVKLGAITLRLLPHPGFSIDNVVVEEESPFGSEPLARVSRAECDLRWRDVWRSRVNCARIFLDHPSVNLVRNAQGQWNVEDFLEQRNAGSGGRIVKGGSARRSQFEFEARDASVNFTLNGTKKPLVLNADSVDLNFDPDAGVVHLHVTGSLARTDSSLPSPGSIDLIGEWKPGHDLGGPFRLIITTRHSLLYGWIPLLTDRNPEIYGLVDATVRAKGSIHRAQLAGALHISELHRWTSIPPSSPMPVDVHFAASWDGSGTLLLIHHLDASFAGSHLHLTGAISRAPGSPHLDLVLAVRNSQLENFLALGARLTGHPAPLAASGRVDGLVTLRGPFRARHYGGFLAIHSFEIRAHAASFFASDVGLHIDAGRVLLPPTRFYASPHVECVAEGLLTLPFPDRGAAVIRTHTASLEKANPAGHYRLILSTKGASLPELIRIARNLGVARLRNVDAQGLGSSSVLLAGGAWPFRKPQVNATVSLRAARLLIPGLTEPVVLRRFHLEVNNRVTVADPIVAQIGSTTFSGWLRHTGPRGSPWSFSVTTPELSLEEASLWFTVLGHQHPLPILDLIPGLRSFAARRLAGRSIFASVNAQGQFSSRRVAFHALRLRDFHARVSLANRVAHVSRATFQVSGGRGLGAVEVNFKAVPAHIDAGFRVTGFKLERVAGWLPASLHGVSGSGFAVGRFRTRGLTRQEMSANLSGAAEIKFKNVRLGSFNPVQATANIASIGSFPPFSVPAKLSSASLSLRVANNQITLNSSPWDLSGSIFGLSGRYSFDGQADLYVHADLLRTDGRRTDGESEGSDHATILHFVGHLKNLTRVPNSETARLTKRSNPAGETGIRPVPPAR